MAETDDIVALIDGTRIHVAKLSLGCCTCGVKTFQPGWHDANCPVRSVAEALDNLDSIATALTEQAAQVERLTRERDEAIREMSGWAAKAGEIEGRLKASEWPGVVEGWKDRATTAERERDEARSEVERKDAALGFYADPSLYASLAYMDGPGTRPILAADAGAVARDAHTKGGENGEA